MDLKIYRHLWGVQESPEMVFPKIKQLGYAGVETAVPVEEEPGKFQDLLAEHDLSFLVQVYTQGESIEEHLESFRKQLEEAKAYKPVLVNSQSGGDWFSRKEAIRFFREAIKIEKDLGLTVAHETHRGRFLFHPSIARDVLEAVDELQLCADLSHWVCVCERMLNHEQEIIDLVAQRTLHIHTRVGYEEGPQVPDPRAPEYERALLAHEAWWDRMWQVQKQRGLEVSYLTPEFGPPNYLHTLPFTNQPVADLWDVCNWMAARQRERFEKSF